MYDAIVVGAGPGGSAAGAALGQRGLHTLLIDREEFPREKACGDAIGVNCFEAMRAIGLEPFDPDTFYKVTNVAIRGPLGMVLSLALSEQADNAAIVSRYVFDELLHQHAIKSGAETCLMNVTGPIIENGQVVGVKGKQGKQNVEYRAKVVIAADGATSAIARGVSTYERPEKMQAVALRGYVDTTVDLDGTIEFAFLRDVQPGYAWFFPMGKRKANIGVGMRTDFYKKQSKTLNDALGYYVAQPHIQALIGSNKVTDIKTWQVPLFDAQPTRTFNGAMLIGDAGGFVDPLTGAGIYQAIATGGFAAQAAEAAIKANNLTAQGLSMYETLWRQDFTVRMKRATRMHNVLSLIPSLMDSLLLVGRLVPGMVPMFLGKI